VPQKSETSTRCILSPTDPWPRRPLQARLKYIFRSLPSCDQSAARLLPFNQCLWRKETNVHNRKRRRHNVAVAICTSIADPTRDRKRRDRSGMALRHKTNEANWLLGVGAGDRTGADQSCERRAVEAHALRYTFSGGISGFSVFHLETVTASRRRWFTSRRNFLLIRRVQADVIFRLAAYKYQVRLPRMLGMRESSLIRAHSMRSGHVPVAPPAYHSIELLPLHRRERRHRFSRLFGPRATGAEGCRRTAR
jgi:hypothetical protein